MSTGELRKKVQQAIPHMPKGDCVKSLALFGSRLHGDSTGESDIDLLVEFQGTVTLFDMSHMIHFLEKRLGEKVDLVTTQQLSPYFRDEVLAEAQPLYAAP